ncbi:hypothetical protein ACS0TY_036147 [Phlomoides rotata]
MSDEGPKLFTSKPKKSKLKTSTPITTASSSSMGAAAPPPPPPPLPQPQDSFARRYKFFGKLVLGFSFITGAYVLLRTVMKDEEKSEEVKPDRSASSSSVAPAISEKPFTPPIVEPIQRPPIPEDQQRELFKWLLEEKRKVRPKDAEERKCIDEEKAILKQFIRAKSLPSI